MKIYIASSEKYVGKILEDAYIRDAYRNKGFLCEIVTLKDAVRIAKPFDVVLLKSIWGYNLHYRDFLKKISMLKKKNIRLINDYDFILWNIDKHKYLHELKNMSVVPTVLFNFKSTKKVSEIRGMVLQTKKTLKTDTLVIKPRISESGYLTFKYDETGNNKTLITSLQQNRQLDFIAQPYRPDILTGEISVVIIDGIVLYGVKRFPGIFSEKLDPVYIKSINLPKFIKKEVDTLKVFLLKKFGGFPNICRVDFLRFNTSYEILEVELIDPDLFFRFIPENMKKKATSILLKSLIV